VLGTDPFISWTHRESTKVLSEEPMLWPRFKMGTSEIQNKHYHLSHLVYLQFFVCPVGGCFRHT